MAIGRSRVLLAGLTCLLLLVAACDPQKAPTASAQLPDLVGLHLDEARDKLDKADFDSVTTRDVSRDHRTPFIDSNWKVCQQEPSAGMVLRTTSVVLHVIKNKEACAEPVPVVATPSSGPSSAAPSASPTPPTVDKRQVTETVAIPFGEQTVDDPTLPRGAREVRVPGVAGEKTVTYEVTVVDGVEADRKLVSEAVTRQPTTQVVAVGTATEPTCDPNYSGACVPIASDVDCAGGSGNGPAYVRGPVRVIGTDIYDLDRDGNGIGCE